MPLNLFTCDFLSRAHYLIGKCLRRAHSCLLNPSALLVMAVKLLFIIFAFEVLLVFFVVFFMSGVQGFWLASAGGRIGSLGDPRLRVFG